MLLVLCALGTIGYTQTNSNPPCGGIEANFSHQVVAAAGGINFTDLSVVPSGQSITHLWEFGNGDASGEVNPFSMFDEGTYTVKLTIKNQDGCKVSIEKEVEFSYDL